MFSFQQWRQPQRHLLHHRRVRWDVRDGVRELRRGVKKHINFPKYVSFKKNKMHNSSPLYFIQIRCLLHLHLASVRLNGIQLKQHTKTYRKNISKKIQT